MIRPKSGFFLEPFFSMVFAFLSPEAMADPDPKYTKSFNSRLCYSIYGYTEDVNIYQSV
jgi:hypothetical protein